MVRKIVLLIAMICITVCISAQDKRFKLDGELTHSGSVASKLCPKDKYGKQCAKVELSIPLENVTIKGENIVGKVTFTNGVYSFFVSTKGNKKIYITADGFKRFDMTLKDLKMREAYSARLIIPEDKNAGKAYVTFESNELDDYIVIIDGKEYEAQGNGKIIVQLPYGNYEYVARARDREEKRASITLSGKPVTENVSLEIVKAPVNVITDGNSTLTVDGENYKSGNMMLPIGTHSFITTIQDSVYTDFIDIPRNGTDVDMKMLGSLNVSSKDGAKVIISPIGKSVVPQGETVEPDEKKKKALKMSNANMSPMIRTGKSVDGVLGSYRVYAYRKGYKPNYIELKIPVRGKRYVDLPLKRDINSAFILAYDASIEQPFGLRLGYGKRLGGYVGFRVSYLNASQWFASSSKPSDVASASMATRLKYNLTEGEVPEGAEDKGTWRYQVTAGLTFSVNRWFYLYAGGGYGESKQIYEKDKYLYTDKLYHCVVAEGGAMLRLGAFIIGAGCSGMFGNGKTWVEPSLTIGVALGEKYKNSPFE